MRVVEAPCTVFVSLISTVLAGVAADGNLFVGSSGTPPFRLSRTHTSPTGGQSVMPGERRYFQDWTRDAAPTATSNFTNALAVDFE